MVSETYAAVGCLSIALSHISDLNSHGLYEVENCLKPPITLRLLCEEDLLTWYETRQGISRAGMHALSHVVH